MRPVASCTARHSTTCRSLALGRLKVRWFRSRCRSHPMVETTGYSSVVPPGLEFGFCSLSGDLRPRLFFFRPSGTRIRFLFADRGLASPAILLSSLRDSDSFLSAVRELHPRLRFFRPLRQAQGRHSGTRIFCTRHFLWYIT